MKKKTFNKRQILSLLRSGYELVSDIEIQDLKFIEKGNFYYYELIYTKFINGEKVIMQKELTPYEFYKEIMSSMYLVKSIYNVRVSTRAINPFDFHISYDDLDDHSFMVRMRKK